jgi:hypothetical protein
MRGRGRPDRTAGASVLAAAAATAAALLPGCSEPCCTYDSLPIALRRATEGELLALVTSDGLAREGAPALLDTASPVTLWHEANPARGPEVQRRTLSVLGASEGAAPVRAIFRGVNTIAVPLEPLSPGAAAPAGILAGDLLSQFSLEIGFGSPQMTLWERQPAGDAFLSAAGYAVLRVGLWGAGELNAAGPSDGIGPRGPYQYPASLVVLRACAAPEPFAAEAPLPACCQPGMERALATGADLSLLLGTGHGPIILGQSAWQRVRARLGAAAPPMTARKLFLPTAKDGIDAEWTQVPRLALVDREADPTANPGACVELGRARRLEQVAVRQAMSAEVAACPLRCDLDPRSDNAGWAHNSAGYLELAGELPVAVVPDGAPLLQALRAEVRPEGPEIDGIIGAGALRSARLELDYRSQPARAIFSCERDAVAGSCRTVGRCPRLPDRTQKHVCFGLPAHGYPAMCENTGACP